MNMDTAKISRFPAYEFRSCGAVISHVRREPRRLRPIKMGAYSGLQLVGEDGALHKEYLHRLICEAFHGAPFDGAQCRHINGDATDNRACNLAWGTAVDNNRDKEAHGTVSRGERNGMARLTAARVMEMRKVREASGASYAAIASQFGVATMTAFRAITNRSWAQQ